MKVSIGIYCANAVISLPVAPDARLSWFGIVGDVQMMLPTQSTNQLQLADWTNSSHLFIPDDPTPNTNNNNNLRDDEPWGELSIIGNPGGYLNFHTGHFEFSGQISYGAYGNK